MVSHYLCLVEFAVQFRAPDPQIYRKGECKTGTTTAIGSSAFEAVITALQAQISVATIVEVLAYTAGISIGMVFVWWGVRKASRSLMAAFKKGKLKL